VGGAVIRDSHQYGHLIEEQRWQRGCFPNERFASGSRLPRSIGSVWPVGPICPRPSHITGIWRGVLFSFLFLLFLIHNAPQFNFHISASSLARIAVSDRREEDPLLCVIRMDVVESATVGVKSSAPKDRAETHSASQRSARPRCSNHRTKEHVLGSWMLHEGGNNGVEKAWYIKASDPAPLIQDWVL